MGKIAFVLIGFTFFKGFERWQRSKPKSPGRLTVFSMQKAAFRSFAVVVPHPDKANRVYKLPPRCGGEDAYFAEETANVIGVADGVGGWASKGVDPGIYSRQLMNFAADEVRAGILDPAEILIRAHMQTRAEGSTTALILALFAVEAKGKTETNVKAANLGDSGFLHLRRGQVLFQSTPQQHSFNFPFQLAAPGTTGDSPDRAEIIELADVVNGDIFVLGTDGLFDNAFASEIADIVYRVECTGDQDPGEIARVAANQVASQTAVWAADPDRDSPFAREARLHGYHFQGGKLDDITVVVAVVTVDTGEPARRMLRSKM